MNIICPFSPHWGVDKARFGSVVIASDVNIPCFLWRVLSLPYRSVFRFDEAGEGIG